MKRQRPMVLCLLLASVSVWGAAGAPVVARSATYEVPPRPVGIGLSGPVAGWAAPHQVVPDPVGAIVRFAQAQLGRPYVWGGTGGRGFDCSGLVQKAFAAVGMRLPRGSIAQAAAGRRISRKDLAVGDLVFSNHFHHVQMYIGDGKVIAADRPGTAVRVSRMLPPRLIDAYVRIPLA